MPTYDYECDACGHSWELFQKITEESIRQCPDCGRKKARRLFGTGAAIVFKGSGFYQTDYRSESYRKGEKDAKGSDSESKSESKSDSRESSAKKSDHNQTKTESTSGKKGQTDQ